MNNTIFLDYFSGSVAGLKPKQRGDDKIVLETLSRDPNVSTWDMDESKRYPLWKTVGRLKMLGYIDEVKRPYPWHRFEITELGRSFPSENK